MTKKMQLSFWCGTLILGISLLFHQIHLAKNKTEFSELELRNIEALTSLEDLRDLRLIPCSHSPYNECQPDDYYPLTCTHISWCL